MRVKWIVKHQTKSPWKELNFQEDLGSYMVLIYWDLYPQEMFVVVNYSRYVEVDIIRKTTTDKVVKSLYKMLQTHGLPIQIVTDGHQIISLEFKDFNNTKNIGEWLHYGLKLMMVKLGDQNSQYLNVWKLLVEKKK